MSKEVVIIGGGIIGLCSAYYLSKSGHTVTVIDDGNIKDGASFGNCGMIAPSHLVPIASPGMISKGMRWMLSQKSPFYLRPRLSGELIRWGKQFYRSATEEHVKRSIQPFGDYLQLSKSLFQELSSEASDYFYEEAGLLIVYQSEKAGTGEKRDAEIGKDFGLEVELLDSEGIVRLESSAKINASGGVYYKGDMHLHPGKLMSYLKSYLEENGVLFYLNDSVQRLNYNSAKNKIKSVKTAFGNIRADEFILSAGAWSSELVKGIGIDLSLLPAKGYSFNNPKKEGFPSLPTILSEGKVAITPMGNSLRFGGTLEITKLGDQKVRMKRIDGIMNAIHSFYPDLKIDRPAENEIWRGYRPCSPDGLPYMGRSAQYNNLIIATGHAMLGLSLGPASGHIINSIVQEENPAVKIDFLSPNRRI